MPILKGSILDGVAVGGLPDMAGIPSLEEYAGNLAGVPAASSAWQGMVAAQNGILQARSMKASIGVLGIRVGYNAATFAKVVDTIMAPLEDQIQDAVQALSEAVLDAVKEILADVMEIVGSTTVAIAESIPVYGYIVEIIWKLAMAIKNIVGMVKDQKGKPAKEYAFPTYQASADVEVFNKFLAQMREGWDWTWAWRPPAFELDPQSSEYLGLVNLEGPDNYLLRGMVGTGAPGLIPGTGTCHQSIIFPSAGAPSDTGPVQFPSIRQQNAYTWKSFSRNDDSPALWCLDVRRLKAEWGQYLLQLWTILRELPELTKNPGFAPVFLGTKDKPGPFRGMDLAKKPTSKLVERMRIMQSLDTVHKRQWRLLDSPTIAYADPDMAAFEQDDTLRSRLFDRRKQLLAHGARCFVDLERVNDVIYYDALKASGVGQVKCGPTQLATESKPFTTTGGAPKEPAGLAPGAMPGDGPSSGGLSTGAKWGIGLGVAGAVAGGVAAAIFRK